MFRVLKNVNIFLKTNNSLFPVYNIVHEGTNLLIEYLDKFKFYLLRPSKAADWQRSLQGRGSIW